MLSLNRVLLIHTDGNTFNNPTLKCIVDLLLEKGVEVTIRYPKSHAPMPQIKGVVFLPFGYFLKIVKNIIYNRICSNLFSWLIVQLECLFLYEKYDLVIGVDRQGLIEAGFIHQATKTPYVFFSFEIMFEAETSTAFKVLEKSASLHVSHWFVQDELRAEHLQRENQLNSSLSSLLPLASSDPGLLNTKRLRDRLGIPPGKNVALAMGSLSSWSMTREIVKSVKAWPDDWVLVVHERYGRTESSLRLLGIDPIDISSENIYFSNHATEMVDDLGIILAGVSVGLALYKTDYSGIYTGRNLEHLGLASGKISTFLRYGIPVLMNEIGLYSAMAKQNGFGLVIEDPEKMGELLPLFKHEEYSNNAKNFFMRVLDFELYKNDVWGKLYNAADVKQIY